jgi:hypothetical protein
MNAEGQTKMLMLTNDYRTTPVLLSGNPVTKKGVETRTRATRCIPTPTRMVVRRPNLLTIFGRSRLAWREEGRGGEREIKDD